MQNQTDSREKNKNETSRTEKETNQNQWIDNAFNMKGSITDIAASILLIETNRAEKEIQLDSSQVEDGNEIGLQQTSCALEDNLP